LLLSIAILAFVVSATLLLFVNCIMINRVNRNISLAYSAFQTKMEEVKNFEFECLFSSSPTACQATESECPCDCAPCLITNETFPLEGFIQSPSSEGRGMVEISNEGSATNLKRIRIRGCFRTSIHGWIDNCNINNSGTWAVKLETLVAE
jgi:hypothetical protein